MQRLASLGQHRVVRHLLRQRVLEFVFDLRKGRLFVNELAKLQSGKYPLQFVVRSLRDARD
jgi:hypothetical protein